MTANRLAITPIPNHHKPMKFLAVALSVLFAATAFAQTGADLEALKAKADAGDPAAQTKMGDRDSAHREEWYRKAAVQGNAAGQGKLGNWLLLRYRNALSLKPAAKAALGDEAVKWMTLAANQGDKQGQANLADVCLEGKLVKQDLIEAYKWGELATHNRTSLDILAISGQSTRDAAILKMTADQLTEAKKRVAEFSPHQPAKCELPEPGWVQQIKLSDINGTARNRLAIINGKTFGSGDDLDLKVAGKKVNVKCLEIREKSVVVQIQDLPGEQELKLSGN
jgi:hypothetical protein